MKAFDGMVLGRQLPVLERGARLVHDGLGSVCIP